MTDDKTLYTIKAGSMPFHDGSGFRFPIELQTDEITEIMWIGSDRDLCINLTDWETLKSDVDAAIAALNSLKRG